MLSKTKSLLIAISLLSILVSNPANASGNSSSRNSSNNGIACQQTQSTKAQSGNSRASTCSYTVTWNANGGLLSGSATSNWFIGTQLTLPSAPTRTNYGFTGWFTQSSGGQKVGDAGSSYIPTNRSSFTIYAQWVQTITPGGNGLSSFTPGVSAWQIKRDYPNSPNGLYWIQNENINEGSPIQIYADMTGFGGGWTLIVANSNSIWASDEVLSINEAAPPINPLDLSEQNGKYSILKYADLIKRSESGFQYRIDATSFGRYGGIWTANENYSFVSTSNSQTNISLNVKWDNWEYSNAGIEQRMPYYAPGKPGLLTTSEIPDWEWWGTLINGYGYFIPAPWLAFENSDPQIIWYWVR